MPPVAEGACHRRQCHEGGSSSSGPSFITKTHKGFNRGGRPFEVEDKKETGEDGLATLGKELLRAQMNGKK